MNAALLKRLASLSRENYRQFTLTLIPNLPSHRLLGVPLPELRRVAKEFSSHLESEAFLGSLPHAYHEEDLLHAFVLAKETELTRLSQRLHQFLPHIRNWALCDSLRPKLFARHLPEALPLLRGFLRSPHPYTVRFGMEMLMLHYLERDFSCEHFHWIAEIKSTNYYVKMMQAWYFATALAKQFDFALHFLEKHSPDPWVQSKTLQKAKESLRLTAEQKKLLEQRILRG